MDSGTTPHVSTSSWQTCLNNSRSEGSSYTLFFGAFRLEMASQRAGSPSSGVPVSVVSGSSAFCWSQTTLPNGGRILSPTACSARGSRLSQKVPSSRKSWSENKYPGFEIGEDPPLCFRVIHQVSYADIPMLDSLTPKCLVTCLKMSTAG